MAETKDKLITAESLKYVHDSLSEKIVDIESRLIGLSQIEAPIIVASIDEMQDITKHYVLDGYIYYNKTIVIENVTTKTYTNQFVADAATLNVRFSISSGNTSQSNGFFVTDFIETKNFQSVTPYNVRLNWEMPYSVTTEDAKIVYFDSNQNKLGGSFLYANNTFVSNGETVIDIKTMSGMQNDIIPDWSKVAYIKLQLYCNSSLATLTSTDITNLEITLEAVYEETTIEGGVSQEWINSGIAYAPTFKTDLIGVLSENNVIYLSENLPSGTYTLKYGDETYDTIGTITVE